MKKRAIALLAAARLFDDVNQGVIPALIPFFISERGLTIAAAAGLGFAIGPAVATPIAIALGLRGTALMVLPVLAMALVLVRAGFLRSSTASGVRAGGKAAVPDRWGAFARLSGPVLCRAIVFYALN